VRDAINAFRIVKEKRPDSTLTIVGEGSQKHELQALAKRLGLSDVTFTGTMAHDEISAVYQANDIYLNCSVRDNFPVALLEAAGSGLALVTTGVGGIPYIVQDRESALFVSPGDISAIAQAILHLVENPDLARSLARRAKELADRCTWEQHRSRLLSIYLGETHGADEAVGRN
jgi:glycosyltransferase involved in cell wall biosynthesis